MIIHSPIISGSLTFAEGATFTLPDNGVYSGSFSGSAQFSQVSSHIIPDTANTYDLGSATNFFRDLYLSSGSANFLKGNGDVAFKLKAGPTGKMKVVDENDDEAEIEVKEILLKDTSGNGNNIKLKVENGALKSKKVNNADVEQAEEPASELSGSFTGSVRDLSADGNATFNDAIDVTGTTTLRSTVDVTGLASLDGGIDVDGAFTVSDGTGNVSTTGTLAAGNTTITGTVDASGLSSLDGGIDVDGVFTVADGTGNVSTTGTLSAGATTLTSTVDVTGLASLDGGIDVDGAFTVSDGTGNVSTTGTLSAGATTLTSTLDVTGNTGIDGNFDVGGVAFTVSAASGNTTVGGTLDTTGLASLDGGIDVAGSNFTVGTNGNVVTTGTITVPEGNLTIGSTAVSATATELNVLDGIPATLTATEVGYLDGVTSNIQDQLNSVSGGATNLVASQSIQEAAISLTSGSSDVTILGNLTVQGTQTQLNTATLNIEDKNLLIASGAANSAAADGAGITIDGASQTLTYSDSSGRMVFNDSLEVGYAAYIDTIYRRSTDNTFINLDATSIGFGVGGTNKLTVDGTETRIVGNLRLDGNLELGDGNTVTSTHTELNLLDGAAAGTIVNSKAVIYGAAGEVNATTLQIGGVSVTSDATELNLLDGVTGTLVTEAGTQTLTNKTIGISQVTELSNLTADEGAQLENIDTTTISATQWGYLGSSDQGIATTDDVTFNTVSATGDIVAYASSDERLKDNIEVISNPIEKVQQLKGVTWDWNDNADELQKSLPNVGVIAQDVEKVLPQLVKDRDNGFKGVDYDKIVGLLIEAIKDQQTQIDELKSKLS